MLTANTYMEVGIYRFAEGDSHLHESAYACLIEFCERIVFEDLSVVVSVKEFTCVVVSDANMTANEKYIAYTRALKELAVVTDAAEQKNDR